jgi:tetratricopeptide (TPR) repeat protein
VAIAALACIFPFFANGARGQAGVSLERLRQRVAENPQDAKLRVALADALDDSGDSSGAIAQYREAIRLDPKFAPAYRNLALAHIRRMEWTAAESAVRDAIRLEPNYARARCDMAVILSNKGDSEEAARAWMQAMELNRDDVLAYMRLNRSAVEKQECERAKPAALARFLAGVALHNSGAAGKAIREMEKATQADAGFALAWVTLGMLLETDEKPEEAKKAFATAFELNPALREAVEKEKTPPATRGEETSREARARRAEIASFRGMIPTLGRILRMTNASAEQKQKATQLLQATAVKLHGYSREAPEEAELEILLGEALRELGEFPRAQSAFGAAIRKAGPEQSATAAAGWCGLGRIAQAQGDEQKALELFSQGLRAAPGDADLLHESAWIYATAKTEKLRDPALALSWAQRAVDATRGRNAVFLRTLAEAQFASGNSAEAVKTLKRAIDLAPREEKFRVRLREMQGISATR